MSHIHKSHRFTNILKMSRIHKSHGFTSTYITIQMVQKIDTAMLLSSSRYSTISTLIHCHPMHSAQDLYSKAVIKSVPNKAKCPFTVKKTCLIMICRSRRGLPVTHIPIHDIICIGGAWRRQVSCRCMGH